MPVPQIDDVRPILLDFELRIRKVLEGAWDDWMSLPVESRITFDKTTRANCIFSYARQRALAEFMNDKEIRAIPRGRTVRFLFRDRVLVRLKKANRFGLGSNISTQATLEFIDPQIPLFDLPEIYHIEVCYQEDEYATRMASIAATCRQGFQKLWSFELQKPAAAAIIPFPTPPIDSGTPPAATARPREQINSADQTEKHNDRGE
ncbi:MAG: hypothetical protein ACLQO1_07365 [Steroidobacteraceae bacterium]